MTLLERLRSAMPNDGTRVGMGYFDRKDVAEAIDAIVELEDELEHAYWDSCGCISGLGHDKNSAECPKYPSKGVEGAK